MSCVVCSFINTEGLFSRTAASIPFPESELTKWYCTKHDNGLEGQSVQRIFKQRLLMS